MCLSDGLIARPAPRSGPLEARQICAAATSLGVRWSKSVSDYGNRYTLDGEEAAKDHSPGLVARNAETFWPLPTKVSSSLPSICGTHRFRPGATAVMAARCTCSSC